MRTYTLSKNAILETFEDGGLLLLLPERRLIELNPTAVEIVKLLDGNRTQEQVVNEIVKYHDIGSDISETQINQDMSELILELKQAGALEHQSDLQ
jgi:hypothetical protein